MAILFVLLGGLMGALFNYLMRRTVDIGGSTKAFLVLELVVAVVAVIILNPIRSNDYSWNTSIGLLGLAAGLLFGCLMWAQGKAVEKGPPGLIFAVVNSASVFPGIVMAFLFGEPYGFVYTLWHGLGSFLVVIGLFWAGLQASRARGSSWWPYVMIAFVAQILMLSLMQWRALHLHPELPRSAYLLGVSAEDAATEWFLPMVFLGAALLQLLIYLVCERRQPSYQECNLGILGGIASACSIFFLLQATEEASPWENALLFPLSCVSVIILSNLWGQLLYAERVNWKAMMLGTSEGHCAAL